MTDSHAGDTPASFALFELRPALLEALQDVGYEQPSPIQAAAIPALLAGRDVLGLAQTGTGKTAAFALPILNALEADQHTPQALILTPTRELAIQVAEAFKRYANRLPRFSVAPIYGGQDMRTQLRLLKNGVQVVVGTPGRIMDHLRRGSLDLSALHTVVLDEADEMLRMGFIDDVEWILEHAPAERQTALFSATMPTAIRKIAQQHLRDPETLRIASKTNTAEQIEQAYWLVPRGGNKLDALTRILEVSDFDAMIVFVRTKNATVELAQRLEARGHRAAAINGDMNQSQRERTIAALRAGRLDILVATDVAARGIDVTRVSHVINFDIPYDSEAYIHRIGRTGRAGRSGQAILFITHRERHLLKAIERTTRQPISAMQMPSNQAIAQRRRRQFIAQVGDSLENVEALDFYRDVAREIAQSYQLKPEEVAALLVHQLQLERPLQPPPEEFPGASGGQHNDKPGKQRQPKAQAKQQDQSDDGGKPARQSRKHSRHSDIDLIRYRVEVGQQHSAKPSDLVGAIANEIGLDPDFIGAIDILDDHSYVELPAGMPKELFNHLRKVWVRNQRLQISIADEQPAASGDSEQPTSRPNKPSRKKPADRKPAGGKRKKPGSSNKPDRKKRAAAGNDSEQGGFAPPKKKPRK
ncbi:MAG: DEAD/DEAH box helicase [Wenzhouxiangellaceae bacterium]